MPRVLLIDDDEELCDMHAEYLATEGFEVAAAHDGVNGAARAREGREFDTFVKGCAPPTGGRAGKAAPILSACLGFWAAERYRGGPPAGGRRPAVSRASKLQGLGANIL